MNETIPEAIAVAIPIVAIIMGIGIGMLSLVLQFRRKSEALKHYHAERMAAIEKGIELPPMPSEPAPTAQDREPSSSRNRRSGLILLFLGLAIAGAMWQMKISAFWWGFVPAALGLALLVSSALEAREQSGSAATATGAAGHSGATGPSQPSGR